MTTTLDWNQQGKRFDADHAILTQVGWMGHRKGEIYALDDTPGQAREPGGYSPLYVCVGHYETDEDGNKRWED